MTSQENKITVHIKYKDLEETFEGSPENVWLSVNRFFGSFLQGFEIADKVILKIDLQQLIKNCEGILAFSREGPNLLVSRNKLTDNETLALWLLAAHLGFQLGLLKSDAISKDELQVRLGKSSKIVSTRLSELVKSDIGAKTPEDNYRITTFGIAQMQKEIIARVKARVGI